MERMMSADFVALGVVLLTNLETTWERFLRTRVGVSVCRTLEELDATAGPRVLLVNYESLPTIRKKLKRRRWSFMFYDECQRLRNRTSLSARIAHQIAPTAERRALLSGTPMDHKPIELWSQFQFLVPGILGSWKDFEREYLEEVKVDLSKARPGSLKWHRLQRQAMILKSKREVREDRLPDMMTTLAPYSVSLTSELLGLPPLTIHKEYVDLWGQQRVVYEELEQDLVSAAMNTTAPLRVTQIGKLQQITGGFLIDDDGETRVVGEAKMRRVRRHLALHREPIVIFAKHVAEVHAITRVCEQAGERVGSVYGKNKKERPRLVDDFQAGKLDVLVCQIRTGGVGIDLFRASRGIIYSSTHSSIDFGQAIKRLHRRGQVRPVNIHVIIARGTIDEAIDKALSEKRRSTRSVLNHLRKLRHGREAHQVRESRKAPLQVHGRQHRRGSQSPRAERARPAAQARHLEEQGRRVRLEQPGGLQGGPVQAARRGQGEAEGQGEGRSRRRRRVISA